MGQYWYPVNLTKKEFIHPHKLGSGLKLWEQLANSPGTGGALIILLAAMPSARGGGDFEEHPIVGRWAGDRIALVGDYAEDSDLPAEFHASQIYDRCFDSQHPDEHENIAREDRYTDITELVCEVIEKELDGKFSGDGWRKFKRKC